MKLLFNFAFLYGLVIWDDNVTSNDLLTSEFFRHMDTFAKELGIKPKGTAFENPNIPGYDFCTTVQLHNLKLDILNKRVKL
jgi:hypothetical protein